MDKYKFIFSGINTQKDAKYFHSKLENVISKQSYDIIWKLLLAKKYHTNIYDYESFSNILKEINNCKYKEDAEEICGNLYKKFDKCQFNTITRIINNKPTKPHFLEKSYIKKMCPHCNSIVIGTQLTKYIICGYSGNCYNWNGCGNDWCFKCEKKLCKNWSKDNLFIYENRIHNEHCCKQFAKNNNLNYNEFCLCQI